MNKKTKFELTELKSIKVPTNWRVKVFDASIYSVKYGASYAAFSVIPGPNGINGTINILESQPEKLELSEIDFLISVAIEGLEKLKEVTR